MESRYVRRLAVFAASVLAGVVVFLVVAPAGSAAGRSAFCHQTDGAFTTCPDGHVEWSDVKPQAFPATHAFLYADQADLDPALSQPGGSPTDTLMLMYDECGMTTPLGPDQYFLVSFSTVEVANGKESLKHYAVHVFTDGTIVFVEDGVVQHDAAGRVRSREIEGQRGRASFGPSPNCAFDHVLGEFEIKLSATGVKLNGGYSPDPIFWGATPPNQPPVARDDEGKLDTGETQVTVDVVANDTDPDDAVDPTSVAIASPPTNGTATPNGDGTVTYQTSSSSDSFSPSDSFTYQVSDTKGAVSNAATVRITACPPGQSIPVTLPAVNATLSLLKPYSISYAPLPLTFTTQTPPSPAYCEATSNAGTLRVQLTCRIPFPFSPCPFPPFIPVTVANSTATATLDFFKASDVPAPTACNFTTVTTGCLLNPGAGGDLVRWTTPGFRITDAFTGTLLHDTGPHTFYAQTGGITSPNASFAAQVQALETYFHVTLISHLSAIDRLAIVQDPPADVLVTDPSGRQTGLRAGTVVSEIPASAYFKSTTATAVIIVEPQVGSYTAQVVGDPGQPFQLSMAVIDFRDSVQDPGVAEDRQFGSIAPGGTSFGFDVTPRNPAAGAIISNGVVELGVNQQGDLNVPGEIPSSGTHTTSVGLRYLPTGADAVAPGCLCEGWGVADAVTGVHGEADVDVDGVQNMTLESFHATASGAVSIVRVGNAFRVTHDYHPSAASPNLYEATVTIENVSGAPVDLRYRRAVDWDVEPTAFNEFVTLVTIQGVDRAANVLFSSDDGFASANPLAGPSSLLFTGDAVDSGPADHGALFDLGFGLVPAGAKVQFNLYYGATGTEADANAALAAVRAEVYSFGQPNTPDGPTLGKPNTFILAFNGVGGTPVFPPDKDHDGVPDQVDNCPSTPNADQRDSNLNGIGDACEVPGVDHSTAAFLQAGTDGGTSIEPTPVAVADEPPITNQLVRIVRFRVDSGLTTDATALTGNLVQSLVGAGAVPPGSADSLVHDVLAGLNHAPVAQDQSVTTGQDLPLAVTLAATDADNDPLSFTVVSAPAHGTLTGTAPNLVYTPAAGYTGPDSFAFKANDGKVDSNTATVSISVRKTLPLGTSAVGPLVDSDVAGKAEAFRALAPADGTLDRVAVDIAGDSTATTLIAGLYADAGGHPGKLLARGTLASPVAGAWNTVPLPTTTVSAGAPYWITILGVGGVLRFFDHCCGGGGTGPSETSASTTLADLPDPWSTGTVYPDGMVTAYAPVVVAPGPATLLGARELGTQLDSDAAGQAEAFSTTASAGGTLTSLNLYLDASSLATRLVVGVYGDAGGHPGALLGEGTLAAPAAGSWNAVALPGVALQAGATYWIALLSPAGSGTVAFEDASGAGGHSETSALTNLTDLPSQWATGHVFSDGPLSAYG